jgi:predicted DNA-binding transcriptional regulator AlpA
MQSSNPTQTRKWVSDKFLSDWYGVSRITIWRWTKSGRLPSPQKIGENTTRWDFEKILASESGG